MFIRKKNIQDRIAFSTKVFTGGYYANDGYSCQKLDNILFTHESLIEVYPIPSRQNTRIRAPNAVIRMQMRIPKHEFKIMMAGGMTSNDLTWCGAAGAVRGTEAELEDVVLPISLGSQH